MKLLLIFLVLNLSVFATFGSSSTLRLHSSGNEKGEALAGEQPLSKIAIHKAVPALRRTVSIRATPLLLGLKGEDTEWVDVSIKNPEPSADDWVGVFLQQSSMNQFVSQSQIVLVGLTLLTYARPQSSTSMQITTTPTTQELEKLV